MQLKQSKDSVLNVKALFIYFPVAFKKKCPHHKFAVEREMVDTLIVSNYHNFYAPEVHIMYLTVVSWFLISFVMGGSGPSRANKFLYEPAPPPLSVWALKPPSWALVHITTYAPMIYSAMRILFWMCAFTITWARGRGLGPGILEFFGPQMALAYGLMPFHRAQKTRE